MVPSQASRTSTCPTRAWRMLPGSYPGTDGWMLIGGPRYSLNVERRDVELAGGRADLEVVRAARHAADDELALLVGLLLHAAHRAQQADGRALDRHALVEPLAGQLAAVGLPVRCDLDHHLGLVGGVQEPARPLPRRANAGAQWLGLGVVDQACFD